MRAAEPQEKEAVIETVSRAFILDPEWTNTLKNLRDELMASLEGAFDRSAVPSRVLTHGTRIVGVSVLSSGTGDTNHLVSGPCVLLEYRSRGLGTLLLECSLRALRESGLKSACGLTKERSTAAHYVYPSFGGIHDPWASDLLFNGAEDGDVRPLPTDPN